MQYNVISEKSTEISVTTGLGGKISNLTSTLGEMQVTLSWTKSQDPDVKFYYIYYYMNTLGEVGSGLQYIGDPNSTDSPIKVPVNENPDQEFDPNNPSVTIAGFVSRRPYWFSVCAVDSQFNLSSIIEVTDINGNPINSTLETPGFVGIDIPAPNGISVKVDRATKQIQLMWS